MTEELSAAGWCPRYCTKVLVAPRRRSIAPVSALPAESSRMEPPELDDRDAANTPILQIDLFDDDESRI
ncbi:hypothetical protein NQU49_28170, partial [Escherichia coli]|uniref:hypothetical protein n=1 Tax=Escherichia coli TaxID=562 RepID=UPI00211937A0